MSWDELGFASIGAEKTPILVVVQSSTGDGDPPDNSAMSYATIRKAHGEGHLKGVQFSMMAVGDSNYTRFMGAPRLFRKRLLELGAEEFYPSVEADEVDGLEYIPAPTPASAAAPVNPAKTEAPPVAPPAASGGAAILARLRSAQAAPQAPPVPVAATGGAALLARMRQAKVAQAKAKGPPPVMIVYGSQTGTAHEIARNVHAEATQRGIAAEVMSWDELGFSSLGAEKTPILVVVQSSTGDGDPPDNCAMAYATIRKAHGESQLKGVQFSMMAIGDSNYTRFMGAPRLFRKRLLDLGAQEFYPCVEADEVDGIECKVDPYMENLWAPLLRARYESAPWSDRKLLHLRFDLGTSGMPYEAGDSLSVMPSNPAEMVSGLLARLALAPDSVVSIQAADGSGKPMHPHIPSPCTLVGRPAYQHEIMLHQPSTLDLLTRFDSCTPPLDALLDALPPMPARLYSITTSPAEHPTACDTCMSVVSFKTKYGDRKGVATTWLDSLTAPGSQTPPTVQRAADFKPPSDLSKPIIMVGPGTGVAPFRGFLQHHRQAIKRAFPAGLPAGQLSENVGPSWLFFGCRKEDEDFLYKSDFKAFVEDKTLSRLETAFSRAQAEKVYVQHLMKQNGEALVKLLDTGAYCYVCGDGANMAKDVHATLLEMLITHKGLSMACKSNMVHEKGCIRDIWC
eukprot:gene30768-35807_t